ncbi:MAG: hydroxymethylglutaryl-CoA lyase [Phycisphaerales bacterium]|nr:MAG: hydroxymethylglutaryl-CoA lyase [Phycisphaerales bacterium]
MADRVRITDVSPRDGLQNERGVVPTQEKARLIAMLADVGVDEIEATSFVSAKWVPQLGDAEEVLGLVREGFRAAQRPADRHPGAEGGRPVISALVPNDKGFERARAFHDPGGGFPLKIAVFTAASETFSKRNTNATIDETLERFSAFLPRAFEMGMAVRMYVSCAVACPFEGPIAPREVRRVVDALRALVPDGHEAEIDLGDTIGVAHPDDIDALLHEFDDREIGALTLHLHDTFGRARLCVIRALERGVRSFDGALAGLGGCPYAGTRDAPAPGNVATRVVVGAAHELGFTTGVDLDALAHAASFARDTVRAARERDADPEEPT